MRRHLAVLVLGGLAVLALASCSGNDHEGQSDGATTTTVVPRGCGLLSTAEITEILGQPYEVDAQASSLDACVARGADGVGVLSFTVSSVDGPAAFTGMLQEANASESMAGIGDEAVVWFENDPLVARLVTRRSGSAVSLRLSGTFPPVAATTSSVPAATPGEGERSTDERRPPAEQQEAARSDMRTRLGRVATIIVDGLPERSFDQQSPGAAEARAVCAVATPEAVAGPLGLAPEKVVVQPLGSSACTISGPGGLNVSVEVWAEADGGSRLDGLGRTRVVDGQTTVIEPTEVEAVGDRAVWLADPVDPNAGELYSVMAGKVLRASIAGVADPKDRAADLLVAIGPLLAA